MGHWGKEKHFIRSNLYNEFWFIYVYISLRTKKNPSKEGVEYLLRALMLKLTLFCL